MPDNVDGSTPLNSESYIYALAGYDVTREETIAAFKSYVQQEARDYEGEFPNEIYAEWYRLRGRGKKTA